MIEVKGLVKSYGTKRKSSPGKRVQAVRGVNFTLEESGALSFIGESGCGKTTIGRILCGLETYDEGTVMINGQDIKSLEKSQRSRILREIQLIQQDPYAALNPARTIEQALSDPLKMIAKETNRPTTWIDQRMREVLDLVGLDPTTVLFKYPHMLSGGQRQRIVIARALTVDPKVLIADEAVSMIDVSLRLGILKLLRQLRREFHIALLFITHDVAAARYVGQDGSLMVLYKGEIIEQGPTDTVIQNPHHPYTQALLSAVPVLRGLEIPGPDRYIPIKDLDQGEAEPVGCLFTPRCPFSTEICTQERPTLLQVDGYQYACHHPEIRHVVASPAPDVARMEH